MPNEVTRLHQQVFSYIRQYRMLNAGECVLVAVSGGRDSVLLLHVLLFLQERLEITLHVVHVNHQFRGAEAERDAEFVRSLAGKLGVGCTIESVDVPAFMRETKLSPQDAARQCRYRLFYTIAEQIRAEKIATAHHADDQAETVLMGLIRGVGVRGLGGIRPVVDGRIIRPLLSCTRKQIERVAQLCRFSAVTDSSNLSRKYLRNAVRLDLLPFLRQHFTPAIQKRLTNYAHIFQEDASFIEKIARKRYAQICRIQKEQVDFELTVFREEDATIQRELLYKAFSELCGQRYRLEIVHVRAVIALFSRQEGEKILMLPNGVIACRTYSHGCLKKAQRTGTACPDADQVSIALNVPGTTRYGGLLLETDVITVHEMEWHDLLLGQSPYCQYFDYEQLCFPLRLRFRQPGDKFQALGMKGKKRLKEFFIDRKVPRHKRHIIPILADRAGIVWVAGYSIDERVKLRVGTNTILRCHLQQDTS